ncbi:interleukin-like EMT inducer domain-containing protein [Lactobacillus delbrueckii]
MSESKSASVVFTNGRLLAKNAQKKADNAKSAAEKAQELAYSAQKTADGKNRVFRGSDPATIPTSGLQEGDLYFTDNALYTWTGSAWEKTVSDTTGAEIHAKVEAAMQESQKSVAELKSDVEAKAKELDDEIAQTKIKTGNALSFYKEQYYQSTSYTELVGGSWSDEVPPRKVEGKYVWSRYVTANVGAPTNHQYSKPVCISGLDGKDGEQGPQGPQGVPGPKGADGQTTYVHVAYANSADGSAGFSVNYFDDALYIGVLTDHTQADSTDYSKYTWSRLKGERGDQGVPGPKGADGRTTYVHFAYANSADGNTNFNTSYFSNALYVGTYTDYTPTDSGDYTKYTWSRLKGDTGPTGATGPQGADGTDAPTITVKSYTFSAANGARADIELTGPNAFKQTVYSRGHNVWVLDAKTHQLKEFVNCDTYTTMSFNHNGANTTLADYLAGLTDSIVVIAAADADSIDQNVRNVLNSMGGSPELGTWPSWRFGHVFIGMSKRSDGTWPLQPQQGYEEAIIRDGSAPEIGCTLSNGGIVANGAPGATGATGPKGDTGDTGFFIGTTPPPNPAKGTVWATNDSSGNMVSAKTWNGSNWVSTAFTQDLVAGNITATKIQGGELDINKFTVKNAQNIPVTSTVSLGKKLSDIEQDAEKISMTVSNGGVNLLSGTGDFYWPLAWWASSGSVNQSNQYNDSEKVTEHKCIMTPGQIQGIWWGGNNTEGKTYTLSFDARCDNGKAKIHQMGLEGNLLVDSPLTTDWNRYHVTVKVTAGNHNWVTYFSTTEPDNVYTRKYQIEYGETATPWQPSNGDIAQLKLTSDSLNAYVRGSRGSKTLESILSMDPDHSSIAQVVNGQIASAIGTYSDGSVRIDGKALHINAQTKIDDATIKSAMIDSIEASKIKSGVLDASQITVTNLDAHSITTGSLSAVVNDLRKFETYVVSASQPWDFNYTKSSYGNWFLIGETTADHVYNGPSYPGGQQKLTPYMYVTSRGPEDCSRITVTVWKDNDPTQYQRVWNSDSGQWSDWVMLPNSQNLISAINLSPDGVTIDGKNIELNGTTTIHGQLNLLPTDQRYVDQRAQGFHNPWAWRDANVFAGSGGLQLQSTIVSQQYSYDQTPIYGLRGDSSAAITTLAPTYLKFTVYPSWNDVNNGFTNQLTRTYIDAGRIETNELWAGNFRFTGTKMRSINNDSLYVTNKKGTNFDNDGWVGFQIWSGLGLGRSTIYTPGGDLYIQTGNCGPGLGAPYSSSGKVDVHCKRVISVRANTVSSRLSVKTDITPVSYDRALAAVEGTEMYDYRYVSDDSGQHYVSGIIDDVNPDDPQYHMDDMLINKERTARIDANLVGYHHVVLQELLKKIDELEIKLKSLETRLESKEK